MSPRPPTGDSSAIGRLEMPIVIDSAGDDEVPARDVEHVQAICREYGWRAALISELKRRR